MHLSKVSTLSLTNDRLSFMKNTMAIENSTLQLWITSQFTNNAFRTDKTVFISWTEIMASGGVSKAIYIFC